MTNINLQSFQLNSRHTLFTNSHKRCEAMMNKLEVTCRHNSSLTLQTDGRFAR